MNIRQLSPQEIAQLVGDINTKGFACVRTFLSSADLERARQFVGGTAAQTEGKYVHFNGPDAVTGSGLEELAHTQSFISLMHDVYHYGTGKPPIEQEFFQVLRCLAGPSGQLNSLIFHYDSYVVTALIPILIPDGGQRGDLLMYPNTRKIRSAYLFNAVDKVLLDNPLTQRVLRACANNARIGPMRVHMVPGNLYLFWGYRTIHTNEPCDPDKIRATAIFHYMNPHKKATGHVEALPQVRPPAALVSTSGTGTLS